MLLETGKTYIEKVHVNGYAGADKLTLKLRLNSMLSAMELHPPGFSPSAILCLRNLLDPLPETLNWQSNVAQLTWERAVQAAVTQLYHRAARPNRGQLPADADVILFNDEAEMLACLSLASSRGELWQKWWGKLLCRRFPDLMRGGLYALFIENIRQLPAILFHLTQWDKAAEVINTLHATEVSYILNTLLQSYNLSSTFNFLTDATSVILPKHQALQAQASTKALPVIPPWRMWLSLDSGSTLAKEHECLLGIGLSIYQAPPRARSPIFAAEVKKWWKTSPPAGDETSKPQLTGKTRLSHDKQSLLQQQVKDLSPQSETGEQPHPIKFQKQTTQRLEQDKCESPHQQRYNKQNLLQQQINLSTEDLSPQSETGEQPHPIKFQKQTTQRLEQDKCESPHQQRYNKQNLLQQQINLSTEDLSPQSETGEQPHPIKFQKQTTQRLEQDKCESPHQQHSGDVLAAITEIKNQQKAVRQITAFPEEGVETRLGGLLYLVNLMQYLELPDCFEKDWGLASQIGAWGLLELLGRTLLDENSVVFENDPLWLILSKLDGREPGEYPGQNFVGNDTFRLPSAWFKALDEKTETFQWAATPQWLRLWFEINAHSERLKSDNGYILVEVPRNTLTPARQAKEELNHYRASNQMLTLVQKTYTPLAQISHSLTTQLNAALIRWLTLTLPAIRYRLHQALGLSATNQSNPLTQFWVCPGRLYVTTTHVDFVTDLNHISVPIRMAGLDRDPGWVPNFGRVVLFHFQ